MYYLFYVKESGAYDIVKASEREARIIDSTTTNAINQLTNLYHYKDHNGRFDNWQHIGYFYKSESLEEIRYELLMCQL